MAWVLPKPCVLGTRGWLLSSAASFTGEITSPGKKGSRVLGWIWELLLSLVIGERCRSIPTGCYSSPSWKKKKHHQSGVIWKIRAFIDPAKRPLSLVGVLIADPFPLLGPPCSPSGSLLSVPCPKVCVNFAILSREQLVPLMWCAELFAASAVDASRRSDDGSDKEDGVTAETNGGCLTRRHENYRVEF